MMMQRSMCHSTRILQQQLRQTPAHNNARNCFRVLSSSSTSTNHNRQSRRQTPLSSSSFWIAAIGSCFALQFFDFNNSTTLAEERRRPPPSSSEASSSNDSTATTSNKEDKPKPKEGEDKATPWYKRYPTHVLQRVSPSLPGLQSLSSAISDATKRIPSTPSLGTTSSSNSSENNDNDKMFQGQCLERQLHKPAVPYPAWDYNWDGKEQPHWSTFEDLSTQQGLQNASRTGTTRHIILIRHGQYNEEPLDDRKRSLTALGRRQAQLTGRRLAELVHSMGPEKFNSITTSDLLRAKQTAFIMAQKLPDSIKINDPDPDLNEGLPAPMIPSRPDIPGCVEEIDEQRERMNRAFSKYIHRADLPESLQRALDELQKSRLEWHQQRQDLLEATEPEIAISTSGTISMGMQQPLGGIMTQKGHDTIPCPTLPPLDDLQLPPPKHEFDILVCHGNLIRYFMCRALQIPPEAWLRLSVFNCSISYIMIKPNGYVSCRMIGDIGHLGYKETTFSGAHGLEWS